MDAATALGVLATIDIVFKYGENIVSWCRAYREAEEHLGELVVRLDSQWSRVKVQVTYLKEWADDIPVQFLELHQETLEILKNKLIKAESMVKRLFPCEGKLSEIQLRAAIPRLPPLTRSQDFRILITELSKKDVAPFIEKPPGWQNVWWKIKYTNHRRSLQNLIREIEDWQSEFDPTWFISFRTFTMLQEILRKGGDVPKVAGSNEQSSGRGVVIAKPKKVVGGLGRGSTPGGQSSKGPQFHGSKDASSSSERPKSSDAPMVFKIGLDQIDSKRSPVLFSSVFMTSWASGGSLLLDPTPVGDTVSKDQISDIENLSKELQNANALTYGLLECKGYVEMPSVDARGKPTVSISVLFALPEGYKSPKSLRSMLINQAKCTPNDRVRLARSLANSVSFVHTTGFVHKNIRPETIIMLDDDESTLGQAFLVGFSMFRSADGESTYSGDKALEKNLYRHPSRQGSKIEQKYKMHHDIYSLGVCLLEIGLWRSFVQYYGVDASEGASFSLHLEVSCDVWGIEDKRVRANRVKDALVLMAGTTLKESVGEEYADIVLVCLKCLDEDSELPEEEGSTLGGISQGANATTAGGDIALSFITDVIKRLHRLRV